MFKNKRYLIATICSLLFAAVLLSYLIKYQTSGQTGAPFNTNNQINAPTPPLQAALKTVSFNNARLKNDLIWTFGSKQQRGWYLYDSLIRRTINTEREPESNEFALSVAYWQLQNHLQPTGVFDDVTLYKMIETWQAKRIALKTVAAPETLLTAPIADFYDPTREIDLLKVERGTYQAYKRMVAAATKDPTLGLKLTATGELAWDEKRLKIVSAFRSPEYQAKLRKASPNSGSESLAVNSPHSTGRTLDIYVGGEPVTTKDFNRALQVQTPVYKWLVKNAEQFGFYPYYYEPWHWEYVPENQKQPAAQTR